MDFKHFLKAKGYTLSQVARVCGCSVSSVSRKISGEYDWPPEEMMRLKAFFDLSDAQVVDFFVRRAPALGERELV